MKPDGAIEMPIRADISFCSMDDAAIEIRRKMGHIDEWVVVASPDNEFYVRSIVVPLGNVRLELDKSYQRDEWSLKGRRLIHKNPPLWEAFEVWSPGA